MSRAWRGRTGSVPDTEINSAEAFADSSTGRSQRSEESCAQIAPTQLWPSFERHPRSADAASHGDRTHLDAAPSRASSALEMSASVPDAAAQGPVTPSRAGDSEQASAPHVPRFPPGRLADQGRTLSGWLASRDDAPSHEDVFTGRPRRATMSGHDARTQTLDGDGTRADTGRRAKPRLAGGSKAIIAFGLSLVAFTIQTEAAQYVQQALGYRKPFLSLFIGHSSFVTLFPLYLLCIRFAEPGVPLSHQLHLVALNLHWQLSSPTRDLPRPTPDSIRKRLSSLSLRTPQPAFRAPGQRPRARSYHGLSRVDDGDIHAEDFDISSIEQTARTTRTSPPLRTWSERRYGFDVVRLLGVFAVLTFGITIPALSWYSAVPLTSMADITTIYNTYAIWALVFSIWFLGEEWERRKVFSVLLACGGVVLVAYGGAEHRRRPKEPIDPGHAERALAVVGHWARSVWARQEDETPRAPPAGNAFLGDMLAFFGAVTMAAYEMAFKVVATLPDEDAQMERFEGYEREQGYARQRGGYAEDEGLLADEEEGDEEQRPSRRPASSVALERSRSDERTAIWKSDINGDLGASSSPSYQSVSPANGDDDVDERPLDGGNDRNGTAYKSSRDNGTGKDASQARVSVHSVAEERTQEQDWIPPPLPFGLHPIIMTSGIGLVTLLTLWIGIPIANALGWEPFELPPNFTTVFYLFVVAFTGIIFNGCFSILLALWGPVLASVSCLLTTVLVFMADLLLGHDFRWISLLGCVSIVAGFGVLVSGGEV